MLGTHNLLAGAQPGATYPETAFWHFVRRERALGPQACLPLEQPFLPRETPTPHPRAADGLPGWDSQQEPGERICSHPPDATLLGEGREGSTALRPQMGRYVNRLFWKESGRRLQLSGLAPDHSTQLKIPALSPGPLEGSLPVLEVPHSVVLIITALYLLTFGGFFAIKVLHATYKNHNGHSRPLGAHPGPGACMELTSFFPFLSLFPQQLRKSGKSVHLI